MQDIPAAYTSRKRIDIPFQDMMKTFSTPKYCNISMTEGI